MASTIISRDEVKTLLIISGSDSDSLIDALIPIVQDYIMKITNNDFDSSGSVDFPDGIKLPTAKIIKHFMGQKDYIEKYRRGEVTVEFGETVAKFRDDLKPWFRVKVL